MRCSNKSKALHHRLMSGLLSCILLFVLCGCGNLDYSVPYGNGDYPSAKVLNMAGTGDRARAFASDICVLDNDLVGDDAINLTTCESAVLFDVSNNEAIYYKNPYERLYPASTTKIMTALVALKYGDLSQEITATESVYINESGAQLAGVKPGDTMTLYQALCILMLYSANDVANMIATGIGGSVDDFVAMMNAEATALGATGTHFVNPHGLSDSDHYTTAYDLYLIFNECVKYEQFVQIISTSTYSTTYMDKNKNAVDISVKNTNGYLSGSYNAPNSINVVGGKTGTTSSAGHCLILYSKDVAGNPYISVVLKSDTTDDLYSNMTALLNLI